MQAVLRGSPCLSVSALKTKLMQCKVPRYNLQPTLQQLQSQHTEVQGAAQAAQAPEPNKK